MTSEQAAQFVRNATDGNGLPIKLLPEADLLDPVKVRAKVFEMAQWFAPGSKFLGATNEYVAALNLSYLAQLLAEIKKEHG